MFFTLTQRFRDFLFLCSSFRFTASVLSPSVTSDLTSCLCVGVHRNIGVCVESWWGWGAVLGFTTRG